ncbi:MAG: YggT family protein [Holosporaceae bacterium]|jgi:uncharacterized protein YggT (Ycf19 family)|nr:YggT family protein [Holosporaceae bacterium]
MDIFLIPTLLLCKSIIKLLITVIVLEVIISWLIIANILNSQNRFVYMLSVSLAKMADFALSPIRKVITRNMGPLDISPIIFVLFLSFVECVIDRLLIRFM